jgi:hypothetical protein
MFVIIKYDLLRYLHYNYLIKTYGSHKIKALNHASNRLRRSLLLVCDNGVKIGIGLVSLQIRLV